MSQARDFSFFSHELSPFPKTPVDEGLSHYCPGLWEADLLETLLDRRLSSSLYPIMGFKKSHVRLGGH